MRRNLLFDKTEGHGPGSLTSTAAPGAESDTSEQALLENSLHAYLASELFDADLHGARSNQPSQQAPSWAPVPSLPASYRSEALSLFGNHAVLGEEGVSSHGALSGDLLTDITGLPRGGTNATACERQPEQPYPAQRPSRLAEKRRRPIEAIRVTLTRKCPLCILHAEAARKSKTALSFAACTGAVCCPQESPEVLAEQLASTRAELDQMRAQQRRLESKNVLLEKCLHLNLSQGAQQARLGPASLGITQAGAQAAVRAQSLAAFCF